MKYNFDLLIDRSGTNATKHDVMCEKYGNDILPLWVADMNFATSEEIVSELKKRIEHPIYGYTEKPDSIAESVCSWFNKRTNYNLKLEDITIITGVIYGLSSAIRAFSNLNDKIIIPTPAYAPFRFKTISNKRIPLYSPMKIINDKYQINFEHLENNMDKNVKIFILCNPQNPTGRLYNHDELVEIANFCEKHNLFIISDEIHADFNFIENKFESIIDINEYTRNNSIALVAPSKSFNLAGLKTSAAITKNLDIQKKFRDDAGNVGVLSVNTIGLLAMEVAYTKGEEWFNQLHSYINENIDFTYNYINKEIPQIKVLKQEATYLMWLDCTEVNTKNMTAHDYFVAYAKVESTPGEFFGEGYEMFIRLNLACPKSIIKQALINIKESIKK